MTPSVTAMALLATAMGGALLAVFLWRKRNARMRDEARKLREAQRARLQSLQVRMKTECAPPGYLDLPHVRLALLLAASGDRPRENR